MLAQTVHGKAAQTVTIASSGTTSEALSTSGYRALAVGLPAALTGTTMAVHGSDREDGTYLPLYDSGGAISETVAASRIVLYGEVLLTPWIKLVSGSTEAAARTITVYMMT